MNVCPCLFIIIIALLSALYNLVTEKASGNKLPKIEGNRISDFEQCNSVCSNKLSAFAVNSCQIVIKIKIAKNTGKM
jgi:hypothetical protein